jgi:DNA-binding transcriptional ArsR family regulator
VDAPDPQPDQNGDPWAGTRSTSTAPSNPPWKNSSRSGSAVTTIARTVLPMGSRAIRRSVQETDCRAPGRVAVLLSGKQSLAYRACVGDVFKALADPTRRTILDELQERDGQTLFELCGRLAMRHGLGSSRQAVSQHLDVLEDAGLVIRRRAGRYTFLHLDTAPLRAIAERWPTDSPEEPP